MPQGQGQQDASFSFGLACLAGVVAATYAASQFFHWSAGWQVFILTTADVLAFAMFLMVSLRK